MVGEPRDESLMLLMLRARTERARLDFIVTDLNLCFTFATVAETAYNMGNPEHAERALAKAEKGYSDMFRLFSEARGITAKVEEELQSVFKQLRERLNNVQRLGSS
jgi:hypothetical protein